MSLADESRRLSASRRALFPSPVQVQDDDSDLGHMSPLSSAGNSSDSESTTDEQYFKSLKHRSDDYEILGSIYKQDCGPDDTPMQKKVVSPSRNTPIFVEGENTVIPDTPIKESPLLKLETPHVTSIQSTGLPKLVRKVQIDEEESPEHKQQKLECNSTKPKVRTALFSENNYCVPVKSFYAKTENLRVEPKVFINKEEVKRKKKKDNLYLCGRKARKNRFGQINTGVRHKIKKPKHRKPSKMQLLKAAINLLENTPLSEYLDELKALQNKPKIIEPINKKTESRKRERSPDSNRKFEVALKGHEFCFAKKSEQKTGEIGTIFEGDDEVKLIENDCISSIINTLEEDKENAELQPPTKRQKLELLSPISQMCDTTSGLAINSPKKARNLTALLESLTPTQTFHSTDDMEKQKLYPVFDIKTANKPKKDEKPTKVHVKKWKSLPANQMLLDAGQKRFGPTQCPECEIVYHMGDPSEEIMHLNYHNAGNVLKFNVSCLFLFGLCFFLNQSLILGMEKRGSFSEFPGFASNKSEAK